MRNVLCSVVAGTAALLAGAASAQTVAGPYISLGVGANFIQQQTVQATILNGVSSPTFRGTTSYDAGFVGLASAGWGFANGLRVEIEGNYRRNDMNSYPAATAVGGFQQKYGAMGNLLYDFDFGWGVTPYVGVGVGEQTTEFRNGQVYAPNTFIRLQHPDINFAYQAIVGIAAPLPVPGLSVTAEYRFLGTQAGHIVYGQYFAPGLVKPAETHLSDNFNHALVVGLRYAFNAAPPPPTTSAPPVPTARRSYLVFFDWDRADLTGRARQVIAAAAAASLGPATLTQIEVDGHTDASGTPHYNQRLSERRAQAVADELMRLGVPRQAIAVRGFGESRPLVPTADGAREPQNRRVEILLR